MTFEELLQIAAEQSTRIFRFEADLEFNPLPGFTREHFRALNRYYITNASWEIIRTTGFPFEQIITSIDSVLAIGDGSMEIQKYTRIKTKFSVTILNQPAANVNDFARLTSTYFNEFGEFLIKWYKLPMEQRKTIFKLDLPKEHKIYHDLKNNNR